MFLTVMKDTQELTLQILPRDSHENPGNHANIKEIQELREDFYCWISKQQLREDFYWWISKQTFANEKQGSDKDGTDRRLPRIRLPQL